MLKWTLAILFAIAGTSAQAYEWDTSASEYNKSYLQVEECFENGPTDQVACLTEGVRECVIDLEAVLESKGLSIPSGAGVSPNEYCNNIGAQRADEHLNAVYQRLIAQGPLQPHYAEGIDNLRSAQRLWLQFANEMCSENNIVGWHAGGSGWGAITDDCIMRLSIQQAGNLEHYFTISRY